jgi:hypothetical protein
VGAGGIRFSFDDLRNVSAADGTATPEEARARLGRRERRDDEAPLLARAHRAKPRS